MRRCEPREFGYWKPFSDEWFDYYICSECGHKVMKRAAECECCKAKMVDDEITSNAYNEHPEFGRKYAKLYNL